METELITQARFKPVADHALLVIFADEISNAANQSVIALDHAIAAAGIHGLCETVPAYVNLLVDFDPLVTDHAAVEAAVRALLGDLKKVATTGASRVVQVCYEGELAPDLSAVAAACGLSNEAVINAHLAGDYRVFMYGFAPGYAYMAGTPEAIQRPRKASPVRDIPGGSILIAGAQCLVTTIMMPTGWSIIGRSPTQVLFNRPERPFLFDVGDSVTFQRIDRAAFDRMMSETRDE
jgi:inhibitor of KinA